MSKLIRQCPQKSIEVIVNRNNEDQQIKLHLIPSNDWNGRGILGLVSLFIEYIYLLKYF